MKSRASSIFATDLDDDDKCNCIEDPWTNAGANNMLVRLFPEHEDEADSGPCAKEKGNGVPEVGSTYVVVSCEAEERGSDVVVVGGGGGGVGVKDGGGKDCVEGLQGLKTQNPLGLGSNFWECRSVLQIVFCTCKSCKCLVYVNVYVTEWV